jgi:hypothetical protein
MATATINYASPVTITMDLANLASSATFVAGRESSQIDNTSNKFMDCLVRGSVSVGTTPTANKIIAIYLWGAFVSLATTPIDVLDGTDSAETLTNTGVLNQLKLAAPVGVIATTSDIEYPVLPFSVAQRFGGRMPNFWGLYVAHDTGVNLRNNAINTNAFEYVGIKYDVA